MKEVSSQVAAILLVSATIGVLLISNSSLTFAQRQCNRNEDCPFFFPTCDQFGQCQPVACRSDRNCAGLDRINICHSEFGFCSECETDEDCSGLICGVVGGAPQNVGVCIEPECDSNNDCACGEVCDLDAGECVAEFDVNADTDGDGLLDGWEACGFDADQDGSIDVDLPAFGANRRHKDLFVELDWMTEEEPTKDAIQALKNAFAVAPINAGTEASSLTWGKEDGVGPDPDTCRDGIDNLLDNLTDADDPDCSTGIDAEPNPDGKPGINLWVDTGNLRDISGNLVGDNLGGGNPIDTPSAPAADICAPDDQDEFKCAKTINFNNAARSSIFRYGISARLCTNEDGAGPDTCSDGKDNGMDGLTDSEEPECKNPSWGELGGNDFLLRHASDLPAIIMHELGHNLNLSHGGDVRDNCKPNYVSVMNYVHGTTTGIAQARRRSVIVESSFFSKIIDYSPPRFGVEDGVGLRSCEDGTDNGENDGADFGDPDCFKRGLPSFSLTEDMLDESMILDAGTFAGLPDRADSVNQFVFTNALMRLVVWPLNGDRDGDGKPDGVDWNGNGRPPLVEDNFGVATISGKPVPLIAGTCMDGVDNGGDGLTDSNDPDCRHDQMLPPVNIDNVTTIDSCKNDAVNSELTSFNDWVHISLPFRQFANSAEDIVSPPPIDEEPTLEELMRTEQEQNTTDLAISKTSEPGLVRVGDDLTYVLTVTNIGPNPAGRVEIQDALPAEVSYKSDNAGCVKVPSDEELPPNVLICDLGAMLSSEQRQIEIVVGTAGSNEGSITNTATVENVAEFAGSDPDPNDNLTTVTTTIVLGICGDGTVDSGEECDDGNTLDGDCCSSTCQFESVGSSCGDPTDADCDSPDTCDGTGSCQANLEPNGASCSDGDTCTQTDNCQSGVCTGSNPLICGGLPASICGTSGADNLTGTSLADVMHGLSGADTISGLGGNDIICGGNGDDTINGNQGNDRLFGQTDNDVLRGNEGTDRMNGNGGNDGCDGGLPNNPNTGDTQEQCEIVINVP